MCKPSSQRFGVKVIILKSMKLHVCRFDGVFMCSCSVCLVTTWNKLGLSCSHIVSLRLCKHLEFDTVWYCKEMCLTRILIMQRNLLYVKICRSRSSSCDSIHPVVCAHVLYIKVTTSLSTLAPSRAWLQQARFSHIPMNFRYVGEAVLIFHHTANFPNVFVLIPSLQLIRFHSTPHQPYRPRRTIFPTATLLLTL